MLATIYIKYISVRARASPGDSAAVVDRAWCDAHGAIRPAACFHRTPRCASKAPTAASGDAGGVLMTRN
jgi:hypothetical protein